MNDDAKNALISYRMARSAESVEAAQLMFDNGMLTSAMNRIYYAMFYAVQAVLITKDASFSKHGQVKGYFNKEFVHKGLFSVNLGKIYNKAFEYRQKFDYVDFEIPTSDMVNEFVQYAKDFIGEVKLFLDCQSNDVA
ncbi:MAG: HEPN domain-containing protein [Thermodesulfobacteriota bacterium]|nr:HEPN domain-containing protein [Thermodesulfobacteriota bacterium]